MEQVWHRTHAAVKAKEPASVIGTMLFKTMLDAEYSADDIRGIADVMTSLAKLEAEREAGTL
ncbi:hypothetical protein E4633_17055 [Geomonas terrae]|uniref:Uncharacterized protein n=1 Tax=Geomonas terrae TaxID=2562681 RepID=A0A4S1CBI8_9BACT|nr:hypothetical protein [Geomonas terrae]TGU70707.1 hypothetical protein E4633_17055 [Geomonas terrae]